MIFMRMRKKPNLVPRMERCSHLWIKDPAQHKGAWRDLMPDCRELHLELGSGKGRFTAETARLNPNVPFIAVERVNDAMVIGMERCAALELKNVFFVSGDAANLTEFFADGEIDRIYINFCDPWPAKRHAKRRLTAPGFLHIYKQVLRPYGEIHFKTDNAPLFAYSIEQFTYCGFHLNELTRNLHEHGVTGVMTDYEAKFHELGTPINRCVARKMN